MGIFEVLGTGTNSGSNIAKKLLWWNDFTGYPQSRAFADRAFGENSAPPLGDRHYARPPKNLFP